MKKLRDKFFKECVDSFEGQLPKVNLTPHDMFEWIKNNYKGFIPIQYTFRSYDIHGIYDRMSMGKQDRYDKEIRDIVILEGISEKEFDKRFDELLATVMGFEKVEGKKDTYVKTKY